MSRLKRSRRSPSARRGRAGYRSSIPTVKSAGNVSGMRSRRRKTGPAAFLKRYYKLIAIASFVVVIAVLVIVLFVFGKDEATVADVPNVTATAEPMIEVGEFDENEEYAYEGVDESVLAGMAGTDDSMFSGDDDQALADALFSEEGFRIGVTIGDIDTDTDKRLLSDLEKASSAAEGSKSIYKAYYYNAGGNYDQQLQDVRSLIKNKVDIIIVGATDAKGFDMVTFMAGQEGIPVVAYDAPVEIGYAINVVADQQAWGKTYGDFVAQNLTQGNVVQVLGSEESTVDAVRQSAIADSLEAKAMVTTLDTAYAQWQKDPAEAAMSTLLEAHREIDAIITEEGMAEGIIDACIAKGRLPSVMCGDVTAGFIKTWFKLVRNGVDVSGEEDEEPIMLAVEPEDFIVCAQPAPTSISAVAFEIALKLAQGRTLLAGDGTTYEYTVETLITNENLAEYYALVKSEKDAYRVVDTVSQETIEALFEPAEDAQ